MPERTVDELSLEIAKRSLGENPPPMLLLAVAKQIRPLLNMISRASYIVWEEFGSSEGYWQDWRREVIALFNGELPKELDVHSNLSRPGGDSDGSTVVESP